MNSLHSDSNYKNSTQESRAFLLLHEKIQRWIYDKGWQELRDIQEEAIEPILSSSTDVIIASPTASGKTEAAFLPICSKLLNDSGGNSINTLYISPLKALINDQFDRISALCEPLEISVHRWHGDVPQNYKKRVLEKPNGILLITPESVEAIFCNHGTKIIKIFSNLSYIIIDELHSFIGYERGRHLQSLLHRIETFIKHRVPRIGLSATLGDMTIANEYIRPGQHFPCRVIDLNTIRQELKLQLRGYRLSHRKKIVMDETPVQSTDNEDDISGDAIEICEDLFRTLRGTYNLVFANRRISVEIYSDLLRRMSELNHVPNEFWPHHGNLSKELREDVESMLKDKTKPSTAVCTTTLEMGIDIGTVTSIGQIGSPPSVASMRQRLGRSGRRGEPAIMRIYIQELEITDKTSPQDRLRVELVQSIAMVELLIKKWCEPPITGRFHLSTLIQQTLSLIAQLGGIKAIDAWKILCGSGPFQTVSQQMFVELLRGLGKSDLITQMADGTLILGLTGERLVNHYSFYTAFNTPEEYQLLAGGKILGSIPIEFPLFKGVHLIFAGRRWEVIEVDPEKKIIDLIPAKGGRPPNFGGTGGIVHDSIRQKMLEVYKSSDIPLYLDQRARDLLMEGRDHFRRLELANRWLIPYGKDTLVFVWRGTQILNTLLVLLQAKGLKVAQESIALNVSNITENKLLQHFQEIVEEKPKDEIELAVTVVNKIQEKYDRYLTPDLLNAEFAARSFNIKATYELLTKILK